jgi:hypothetical protein
VLLCAAGIIVADRGTQNSARENVQQRRLIIRSGTLFTSNGIPINLSGFDSEIEAKSSKDQNGGSKQIEGIKVRRGDVFVRAQDLGKLLQGHVHNSKLSDLKVETDGSEMKISGHLKKALPVDFEIKGPVSLTGDGFIDLHESSMKIDKLPMKGLADFLGMEPDKVVGEGAHKGISATKSDIMFDPDELWGFSIQGKVTAVKVVRDGLLLVYGDSSKNLQASVQPRGKK